MRHPMMDWKWRDEPVRSLADALDFYGLTIGFIIWLFHRDVEVEYRFRNRSKRILLVNEIPERQLRDLLDQIQERRFTKTDLHYIWGTTEYDCGNERSIFSLEYIRALEGMRLPPYKLTRVGDQYDLRFPGPWWKGIFWETAALAGIKNLLFANRMEKLSEFDRIRVITSGIERLAKKIEQLRECKSVRFSDFGTRRRAFRQWQHFVDAMLKQECPEQFLGTSCVASAMENDLMPMGTASHQHQMVLFALGDQTRDGLIASQRQVLDEMEKAYGNALTIFLPDTFTTDFFLKHVLDPERAARWKGVRADSMQPEDFGRLWVEYYRKHGIDPTTKMLIPSDSLNLKIIRDVSANLWSSIKLSYGWGTDLTDDFLISEPASFVIKPWLANGRPCVKISDEPAKAMGEPDAVEAVKQIVGYNKYDYMEHFLRS